MTTTADRERAAARAARNVPHNPHPLCRYFIPKPAPAAFWCATCGWNGPMHADEVSRSAIAAELRNLAAANRCDRGKPDDTIGAVRWCQLPAGHKGPHHGEDGGGTFADTGTVHR